MFSFWNMVLAEVKSSPLGLIFALPRMPSISLPLFLTKPSSDVTSPGSNLKAKAGTMYLAMKTPLWPTKCWKVTVLKKGQTESHAWPTTHWFTEVVCWCLFQGAIQRIRTMLSLFHYVPSWPLGCHTEITSWQKGLMRGSLKFPGKYKTENVVKGLNFGTRKAELRYL